MKNTLSLLLFPSISYRTMIKRTFLALALMGSAATASPYVVYENNRDYQGGGDPSASVDLHVGYEKECKTFSGDCRWFVQGGPVITETADTDSSADWSLKGGGEMELAPNTEVYGEVTFANGNSESDQGIVSTQFGVKYNFE